MTERTVTDRLLILLAKVRMMQGWRVPDTSSLDKAPCGPNDVQRVLDTIQWRTALLRNVTTLGAWEQWVSELEPPQ